SLTESTIYNSRTLVENCAYVNILRNKVIGVTICNIVDERSAKGVCSKYIVQISEANNKI
ncbi:unnamed protein product, partial [marine sediment metagenome]